jgi:hypothetical protein
MNALNDIRKAYQQGRDREAGLARAGTDWWQEEESAVEQAAEEAALAWLAAERGDLTEALTCAERACRHEAEEYPGSPTWRPLRHAVQAAIRGQAVPHRKACGRESPTIF